METINIAIKYFGNQTKLADALKVTPMAVSQWKKRQIPLEIAKKIEEVTNGDIMAYQLRPDFFDIPKTA